MCGIFGIIGDVPDKFVLVRRGLIFCETRGRDASGVWSKETGIIKRPVPGTILANKDEIVSKRDIWQKQKLIIGHARAATCGSPDNNGNNHPLETENWILVHNGIVTADEVWKREPKSEVDSHLILQHIEKYGFKGLENISGSMAILLVNKNSGELFAYRHGNPLWHILANGGAVLASTGHILSEMLKGIIKVNIEKMEFLDEDYIYKVHENGMLERMQEIKPKPYASFYSGYYCNFGDDDYYDDVICSSCLYRESTTMYCDYFDRLIGRDLRKFIRKHGCSHYVDSISGNWYLVEKDGKILSIRNYENVLIKDQSYIEQSDVNILGIYIPKRVYIPENIETVSMFNDAKIKLKGDEIVETILELSDEEHLAIRYKGQEFWVDYADVEEIDEIEEEIECVE